MKLKDIWTVGIVTVGALSGQAESPVYASIQEYTRPALIEVIDAGYEPRDTLKTKHKVQIANGKSITINHTANIYSGDIFDKTGKRMLEVSEQEDKKAIKDMLTNVNFTFGKLSTYESDLLGKRELGMKGDVFELNLNGTVYHIKLVLKLHDVKKIYNPKKGEYEFRFETSLKNVTTNMKDMVDIIYMLLQNTEKKCSKESYKTCIPIYEIRGKDIVSAHLQKK